MKGLGLGELGLVWEYFRSWSELARELAIRASIAEHHNNPIRASKLLSLIEKVREFDRRYFDELKRCLGYVLYRFYDDRMRTEHYRVEAIVLYEDGPYPEVNFIDVEWWLKEQEASL
jgi:hypothetical protein